MRIHFQSGNHGSLAAHFKSLDENGLNLLSKMVVYDPAKWISCKMTLNHPYFDDFDRLRRRSSLAHFHILYPGGIVLFLLFTLFLFCMHFFVVKLKLFFASNFKTVT